MIVGIGHLCQKTILTVIGIGNRFLSGIGYTRHISAVFRVAHTGLNALIYMFQHKYLIVLNIGKCHTRRSSRCNDSCLIGIIAKLDIQLISLLILDNITGSKCFKAELLAVCAALCLQRWAIIAICPLAAYINIVLRIAYTSDIVPVGTVFRLHLCQKKLLFLLLAAVGLLKGASHFCSCCLHILTGVTCANTTKHSILWRFTDVSLIRRLKVPDTSWLAVRSGTSQLHICLIRKYVVWCTSCGHHDASCILTALGKQLITASRCQL